MKIPALVLAGGRCSDELYQATHEPEKAFVKVGGRPLIQLLVGTLQKAPSVGAITLVGNAERLKAQFPEFPQGAILEQLDSLFNNFMKGIGTLKDVEHALVCACDTPLLAPGMVEDFLARCTDPAIDFYYPISEKSIVERRFPEMKRTYARLAEGRFTGGNLMRVSPRAMARCEPAIREVIVHRKSVPRLASKMGAGFLLKYLLHRLSIRDAEEKAERLLGIRIKAVQVPFPEMGCDLDKLSDFLIFEGLLKPNS